MNEQASEIFRIFFQAVVQGLDVFLVQKTQNALFELTAPLAGDDLHNLNTLLDRVVDDLAQGLINVTPAVKDLMQVQFELGHVR